MKTRKWVPITSISVKSSLPVDEVKYRIGRLGDFELIEGKKIGEKRVRLKFSGYDALALNVLVKRDVIDSIGGEIGVGKESDIRLAKKGNQEVATKFHREGKVNFRQIKKMRDYIGERKHYSWMYVASLAAKREYNVLSDLYKHVDVPKPYDWNRHVIVMENINGDELSNVWIKEDDVNFVFEAIMKEIYKAFDHGYIHADMSEYNILISEDRITIIDWPQAVSKHHPNAYDLLRRDLENLCNYFQRKYNLDKNFEELVKKFK